MTSRPEHLPRFAQALNLEADADIGLAVVLAPAAQQAHGLLGYATVVVDGWRLSGIRVRRTAAGKHVIAFPEHRTASGTRDPFVAPLDQGRRQQIETAILREYFEVRRRAGRRP